MNSDAQNNDLNNQDKQIKRITDLDLMQVMDDMHMQKIQGGKIEGPDHSVITINYNSVN